jgi:NADH-quinone oxidoreductase subunit G
VADLLTALGQQTTYFVPSDVFAALASAHPQFAGMNYETLGLRGLPVLEQQALPAGVA